ncbi:DUF4352 domain-containing protein [Nocardia sp. NPDC050378]|uniref:DUF4352 domain-containing protein n=1 Tax=Nocardia sp. NPDC050378 TaxID=3155400 RepID=UPI0033C424E2
MTNPPYPPQPYPQQPYGGRPGYPHPPRPPKSNANTIILAVVGGFLALCGFGGCVAVLSDSDNSKTAATFTTAVGKPTAPAQPAAPAPTEEGPAPAGTPVRDGKFEFTVTAVDRPVKVIGDNPYLQKTAQGEYIAVHLTVTNIGDKPQSYFASNQKLFDDQGREFENDTMAGINVNDDSAMMSDINPGNSVDVVVVFDVPAGTVPASLELHDSMFSGGAQVALR